GKYDLVEPVLREFGARFVFDAVAIRPGKPVVFAICRDRPVFGLPGNPVSTMVTFELFVRPAVEILSGQEPAPVSLMEAALTEGMQEKPGLTHFLPAVLDYGERPRVTPLRWQGSGDIVAMSRANCLLVIPPDRETIKAGEPVTVIPRGL
ncbi:MAG TPA: molybdopterin-binding protein, partial [Candidatus Acidoferrum sp.]|nr:molybdopterin-binding protein [Candidatus Acidoferrum sp.]